MEQVPLAEAVRRISESMMNLRHTGLNEAGVIALIHDDTKVNKRTIKLIFNSLEHLQEKYGT